MVDDAHAVGALGPGGRGSVAEAGLAGEVDVLVGTLGKALGSYGAYACVSAEIRELLVNTARPLIFSTGLPPACAAAAEAALGVIAAEPERITRLRANAADPAGRARMRTDSPPEARAPRSSRSRSATPTAPSPPAAVPSKAASTRRRSARRPSPTEPRGCG